MVSGADGMGPRALGNRSILCDPRRADMKDILNQKIKGGNPSVRLRHPSSVKQFVNGLRQKMMCPL